MAKAKAKAAVKKQTRLEKEESQQPASSPSPYPGLPSKRSLSHDGQESSGQMLDGAGSTQAGHEVDVEARPAKVAATIKHESVEPQESLPPIADDHIRRGNQRAHLAHAAPHLFDSQANSPSASASASISASASPASSRSPSPSPSSSSRPYSPHPPTYPKRESSHSGPSRHVVPAKFRGPLPRDSDAQDIAPRPLLQSTVGSDGLFQCPNTPLNRNSWRYTLAGPSTAQLPFSVYRSISSEPAGIRWDWSDRSAFTKLSADADVASSDGGWRAVRGNVPVRQGSWYCEIEILPEAKLRPGAGAQGILPTPMKDGPHVRLGWARRESPLNAPVGFDGYSYGLRDVGGQRVFLSRASDFGKAFQPGDVVGMYIHIPPLSKARAQDKHDPRHVRRNRIPIRYRSQMYFEQLDYAHTKEMERLLERSWAGEQLMGPNGSLTLSRSKVGVDEGLDPESGGNAAANEKEASSAVKGPKGGAGRFKNAPSNPTAPPGTGKSKRQASGPSGPKGKNDSAKKPPKKELRPLPTLGESSRIGFFLNGKPLGWAFRDLLDFRPLRLTGSAADGKAKSKVASNAAGGAVGAGVANGASELGALGLDETPLLTTTASLAAIMKSRENNYDDGSLGYYAALSVYGGAQAKIRARAEDLRFSPSAAGPNGFADLERLLENADRVKAGLPELSQGDEACESWWGQCRPLEERYDDFWEEQWQLDLGEEERARLRAKYAKTDDVDGDGDPVAAAAAAAVETAALGLSATPEPSLLAPSTGATPSSTGRGGGQGKRKASQQAMGSGPRKSFTPKDWIATPSHSPSPSPMQKSVSAQDEAIEEAVIIKADDHEMAVAMAMDAEETGLSGNVRSPAQDAEEILSPSPSPTPSQVSGPVYAFSPAAPSPPPPHEGDRPMEMEGDGVSGDQGDIPDTAESPTYDDEDDVHAPQVDATSPSSVMGTPPLTLRAIHLVDDGGQGVGEGQEEGAEMEVDTPTPPPISTPALMSSPSR